MAPSRKSRRNLKRKSRRNRKTRRIQRGGVRPLRKCETAEDFQAYRNWRFQFTDVEHPDPKYDLAPDGSKAPCNGR
jgi:hypothetical protein